MLKVFKRIFKVKILARKSEAQAISRAQAMKLLNKSLKQYKKVYEELAK